MTGFALGRLAWAALPALLLAGPQGDPCRAHPLAQLSRELEPGLPFAAALSRFEAYASRSGPAEEADAVVGSWTPRASPGASAVPSRILFVQDLWMDQDLVLTAWFDADLRLQGSEFRCQAPER